MSLKLIAPGRRKRNIYYILRGTIGGRYIEVSTKTRDYKAAQKFKAEFERQHALHRVPEPGEELSLARGVDIYSEWRDPSDADMKRLEKLKASEIGHMPVSAIRHADLVKAANDIFSGKSPATKNREVMRPAAAVLHYCAEQKYCAWLRVKLFKEARPKTRAVSLAVARSITSAVPDLPLYRHERTEKFLDRSRQRQKKKRLLLLWLFHQGPRISDALRIRGEDIDMQRRVVRMHVAKPDIYVEEPLHDEVWELLANDPPGAGKLFPWSSRSSVYNWLRPMMRTLGVSFTPHMARHSRGKWLNESGASLRQIMDALHHQDPKSSMRYQSTDIEVIRESGRKVGNLLR